MSSSRAGVLAGVGGRTAAARLTAGSGVAAGIGGDTRGLVLAEAVGMLGEASEAET